MATTEEKVRVNFVTAFDGKALNNAKGSVAGFEQLANKAAKAFIGLFAVRKITAFGKASLDAFTADQKAAQALSKTLINLGLGFQSVGVEQFIQKLETTTGVLDDQLRPAFARLARQTGDVAKTQTLLNLALDVSAGTGQDLMVVSNALAKAYGGQFTSLSKLGAGLTKADLASNNFVFIQEKLTKLFAGQAAAAAETYAGKIDRLKVAFDNMKESIGQGLVLAFENLSGPDGSIAKTSTMIENLGYAISGEIQGIGMAIAYVEGVFTKIYSNPFIKWIIDHSGLKAVGSIFGSLADAGKQAAYTEKLKANTKALEQAYAQQKKGLATSQTQLSVDKAALALKQASKVMDLDQIQLYAALAQAKGSDIDRLKLQQAILDGNATSATTLANKILASNGLIMDLQGKITADPFAAWTTSLDNMLIAAQNAAKELAKIQGIINPGPSGGTSPGGSTGGGSSYPGGVYLGGQKIPIPSSSLPAMDNSIYVGGQKIDLNITLDPGLVVNQTQGASANGVQTTLNRNSPSYF
jgi:hypothetical protein